MKHIILIGFMGTGKSTVGQEVAKRLNCNFVDLDAAVVAQEGRTIPQIFEQDGETYFRTVESDVLFEVLERSIQHVIATGGGVVLKDNNREWMRAKGYVIHLSANPDTIIKRIQQDGNRPLLQGNLDERVHQLMAQRKGMYDFAHTCFPTDYELATKLAARICKWINRS